MLLLEGCAFALLLGLLLEGSGTCVMDGLIDV